ncbi:MAG: lipocalin family protein [Bacteroidota bacterium]
MKKWKSLSGIACFIWLVLLSACEEDEETPRQTLLLGTWNLSEQSIEQVTVSSGDNSLTFSEEEFVQYLAITGEDVAVDDLRLFSESTDFTFNDDQSYRIEDTANTGNISGTWRLIEDETQLVLQLADQPLVLDIFSLSSNQMQTRFLFNQVDEGIQFEIDFILNFTK